MSFDIEKLGEIDQENMLELLLDFPQQCKEASNFINQIFIPSNYRDAQNIVITGMGGSAIGGDIAKSVLSEQSTVPIIVNRNYRIPEFVNEETLFIAVSYSGNTEETLSSFEEAQRVGAKNITITSNGKLEQFSSKAGFPCIKVPSGQPPRASLGYLFIPLLSLLSRLGFAPKLDLQSDIKESIELLSQMIENELKPEIENGNIAKDLAKSFYGKMPIIYASQELEAVAIRWKGQMCENAKNMAYCNVFPEMNHNEIEGWNYPAELFKQCCVVILRDKDYHPMVNARMDITSELLNEYPEEIHDVRSRGESMLARLFSLICIGDWTSFYLAMLNEIDPTPVERITELKNKLKLVDKKLMGK